MPEPTCHYCDQPAEEECPTCGRLYCADHGDDVCMRCLSPEAATPSSLVYRGSLLALAVGVLVAIFLIVRPPQSASTADDVRVVATATPATGATATPTPPGTQPAAAVSGTAVGTASPAATPGGSATATAGAKTYTVQANDTLGGIAVAHNTTTDAIIAVNPGLTPETPLLIGRVLNLP
ncbi:MAG TPA: LysM domain-containing protein [Tepidiformaceae bacterium]|nr:LysM domain-containing protein [Tepidiformaceae bacterium]